MSNATAGPVSRVARETLARIAELPTMGDDKLTDVEAGAARDFTALSLHRKLPEAVQGDRTWQAWEFRKEWQQAAEALWLAIQAERTRRRSV